MKQKSLVLASVLVGTSALAAGLERPPIGGGARGAQLVLDGKATAVRSADGGAIGGIVVTERPNGSFFAKKHLAGVKYEEMVVELNPASDGADVDWLENSVSGSASRAQAGSLVECGFNGEVIAQRDFSNALITEIQVPDLDAASKVAGFLTVKFQPELIRSTKPSGKCSLGELGPKQKQWLVSNFRLDLPGVNTSRVARIEGFTIKQGPVPGAIEFPNLRLSVSDVGMADFAAWHEDFVVRGNSSDSQEKIGAIILLGADLKEELGRINLYGVGISRIAPARVEPSDAVRRSTVDLYVERFELKFGKN